jgi:hypothetical protein
MSQGMMRLSMAGMGVAADPTSFYDALPGATAAELAATAAAAAEAAKKATTAIQAQDLANQAQELLKAAKLKAAAEAGTKTQEAGVVPVVTTGVDTGKILGMEKGTFLLVAGLGVLWVMGNKQG